MSKRPCNSHATIKIKRQKSSISCSEVLADDKVVLNVLLNCEETKSSKTKQIHFRSLPATPLEIKKKIEEDFSIPSCVQTLHYQSMILKDSDQLQHAHFRSGDTFTVDYPIEAECEMTQNVIKWLKELLELLESIRQSLSEMNDLSVSSNVHKIEDVILEGEQDGSMEALTRALFAPWNDKQKLMNQLYFQQEGGLDMLMKVYDILVSKEWGKLGISEETHIDLENVCSMTICNYAHTFPFRRQVVQLGGLEMCTTTLLRRQLQGDESNFDITVYNTLGSALYALCNLSELPECRVPLAKRAEVMNQILAVALHPFCDCNTAIVSAATILCLCQSPEAHVYIARKEVVEKMLEMCDLKQRLVNKQSSQSQQEKKEDTIVVNALKCYTSIALALIGVGSPHLLSGSIPPHLLHQILNLMSDILEAASPAEMRLYEEKEEFFWGTFLPYLRCLYKPSTRKNSKAENSAEASFHITFCNVLLHGLENALGRDVHLEVLLKEGLLDYVMCLPAILPGECQPKARSLVNELGKHIQLQPPSLCTLAKAHVAKIFCGLQPVMEMSSIGQFLHEFNNSFC